MSDPPEKQSISGLSEGICSSPLHQKFLFDCEHLQNFCTNFEDGEITDQTDAILGVKLEDLEHKWDKLNQSFEKLVLSPEARDSREFKAAALVNYNVSSEAYYTVRSTILEFLGSSRLAQNQKVTIRRPSPSLNGQNLQNFNGFSPQSSEIAIKLPPCDTEVFKGGYEEWPSFRDMFTAVYINHPKLTSAQKLYHLRNKTRDSAGAIVKRYPLCDENFDIAWAALRSRYENKRVLVDNQLKTLFNINVAKIENSDTLQRIQCTVNDCLATLKSLDVSTEGWDPILIYLISTKLPDETLSFWEQSLKCHRELPKWSQMNEFLCNRYEIVERLSSIKSTRERHSGSHSSNSKIQTYHSQEKLDNECKICNENHSLRICPAFRKLNVQERLNVVAKNKYCNNCLSIGHIRYKCKSKSTCAICHRTHHTLLHIRPKQKEGPVYDSQDSPLGGKEEKDLSEQDSLDYSPSTSKQAQIQANFSSNLDTVLLRTALVQIDLRGELFTVRALIDPGSQRTFVSERIRDRLQIPYRKSRFEIVGIGGYTQNSDRECDFFLFAKRYNVRFSVNAIVLPKLTKLLPSISFELPDIAKSSLQELDLADPNFNKSTQIDIILGNDSERFLNLEGIKRNICGIASAYNTVFGWVLSGPISTKVQSFTSTVGFSENSSLDKLLRKFWEQEEIPFFNQSTAEDDFCEEFYRRTTTRQSDGRYMVRLPFRKDFPKSVYLGPSRHLAIGQYASMERSLNRDPSLRTQYNSVLNEYLSLDHMEASSSEEVVNGKKCESFYLPHHAVVRPDHKTTKVRVVFNASRKTDSGYSLNDTLYTGPTLQSDLTSIVLNWRKYKYVYSGDIQKMYRQILVDPRDRPYQKIVFRAHPNGRISDYQLKTVTFGINCAPFLAIRTLLELASSIESDLPEISTILKKETYVDDILSGGFTIEETTHSLLSLKQALLSAGFPLKKITANCPEVLRRLEPDDLYDLDFLRFQETSSTKTLGIKWNALRDTFTYTFTTPSATKTKRGILSKIAQLFDPAGWITPVIVKAKILMQQLWLDKLGWDENIGLESIRCWDNMVSDFAHIEKLNIQRWLQYTPTDSIQLHGFSDASKSAYAACIYIRCETSKSVVFCNLFMAKSKVAPLKTICLPRLELNGAVLLAKLVHYVTNTFDFKFNGIYLWTDSSIVLGWLSKPPWNWETYVANRVAQIHELAPNAIWAHVPTSSNPADLGTRGCRPQDLVTNLLWWQGPPWLTRPASSWPRRNPLETPDIGKRNTSLSASISEPDILARFSSYHKALRTLCYVFRFYNRCRMNFSLVPTTLNLSQEELKFVKSRLIMVCQKTYFEAEYNSLLENTIIPNKSALKPLNPFLDQDKILRVNGRLVNSSLSYSERYPMILPGKSHFCQLYLQHIHIILFHGECNQMCRLVQTEFYISRLKPNIKSIIHKCKTCAIFKKKSCSQVMAPLPPERCTLTPPFHTTGIDFAGPYELKCSAVRNSPTVKGYVVVFVCFATKAIHLEICSELSSSAFEASFARFIGRRGLPHKVVSDNGRNFLGASRRLLREFSRFLKTASTDIAQRYKG
ncbi:uncharacterized protein LOC142231437 [Haematobia irritans]|uniref:uncharacterized protein LOC142231437 n=1 Tax=Haematobia irritans TaxID=7368 RepID=UPI003F4F9909